jgi:hypothetical protein
MNWLWFWIGALTTYRLTILIVRDLGPWGVFKKLRSFDRCSKLLKCPFCVSPYMGSLVSLGFWLSGITAPIVIWFCLPFAFSAITIALDRTFTSDYNP